MKIWIVKEGEPLPCDDSPRLMRMGMLAEYLAEHGHEVVWWATTFIHGKKIYRCQEQREINVRENERLILLHSKTAYQKNVSLKRIRYHKVLANEFARCSQNYEKPDIILCSYPTVQFALEAEKYGKRNHVPVILDVRDLWPDIFVRVFPVWLRWLVRLGTFPMTCQTRRVFKQADAILGVVPMGLNWGLEKAGREQREFDRKIFIGYKPDEWTNMEERQKYIEEWETYGVTENTWNICFFGTMSNSSLDMDTCICAVKKLSATYPDLRLVLCGDGDGLARYKETAGGSKAIVFPGWADKGQIQSIVEISKAGIYPYKNTWDFKDTFSNKIIGYLAGGLPVLSSLQGFSKEYIEHHDIGLVYGENDVDSCAKAIEILYQNEQDRVRKWQNSLARFQKDFAADVVNKQFEALMEEMVARKK